MSNRMEERGENRKPIWWVRPLDDRLRVDETAGHLFRGDDDAMGKHINELHRRTGVPYCAQSVGA